MTLRHADTDVHATIRTLEASPQFKVFCVANPGHYLVHAFAAVKSLDAIVPLELGYYGAESDKITVFRTAPIEALPAEEVFKEQDTITALDTASLFVGFADALHIAKELHTERYSHHPILQAFCVLQHNSVHGKTIWNITIVLGTLHMLNVRLDASNGEALSCELQSLMSLKAN